MRIVGARWRWWHGAVPLGLLIVMMTLPGCGLPIHATPADEEHAAKAEHAGEEEDDEAHVTVRAEPARRATSRVTVEGLGRCEALPDHLATLTPAVEGHVHELLVALGAAVKKGQPIVELDESVAQADLQEKTATRDGLIASLALLQSLPRAEEIRANELAIDQAKVAVDQAQEAVDRLRPLLKRHEISEQQFFIAEKALEQTEIQKKTAEAQLRAMQIGPRPEAVAEARGKIKTADALVAFSHAHLEYHIIRSPIEGVLESLNCHPGQTIAIGSPIGEVVDTRQVFAAVWLPPRSASSVHIGLAAKVEPADLLGGSHDAGASADQPTGMTGKVAFVGRVADPQTGNLPIHLLVNNPEGRLTIGESVHVSIVVSERPNVLQVPAAAVLDLGEGPVLSVVRDGKSAVLHPEARTPRQGWVEVAGTDLKEGELVIVDGGYNLPEKTPVKLAGKEEEDEGKDKDKDKDKEKDEHKDKEKDEHKDKKDAVEAKEEAKP